MNTKINKDWLEQTLVTEKVYNMPWSGNPRKYFRCGLCGHFFEVGDTYRIQYTNNLDGRFYGGNPKVCSKCDEGQEKTVQKWKDKCDKFHKEIKEEYWTFIRWED